MKHHHTMGDRFRALIAYDPLAEFRKKKHRKEGGRVSLASHIDEQAKVVDTSPTDGQKEAGNYRKGHVKVHGLDISIENPRGSWREGGQPDKRWKSRLPHHYGYIRKTEGGDGDHVDVYLGHHLKSPHVFVVDQHHLDGDKDFDEHKCFIGFGSKSQAREAYHSAFSDGKGKDRIGHIETMTVDEFKDWLKDGDTTQAVKHRAAGGAVLQMADGGAPVFAPDATPEPLDAAPVFPKDATPEPLGQDAPQVEGWRSAARGIGKGLSFGFNDEMRAIDEAGGAKPGEPGTPLTTVKGLYNYWSGDPEAEKTYNESVARERAKDEQYHKAHPYLSTAGEIAGAIPAMAMLPEADLAAGLTGVGRAAAKIVEGAIGGGEYGAISGVGEGHDAESRVMGGLQGTAGGIIGGGIAGGVGHAVNEFAAPVVGAIRAARDPEKEAATRLTRALQADQELIAAGKADGMSPQEWVAARQRGEPVTLADLGSTNTQALLRSSANTSPEGRAVLEKAFNDRFAGQSERVADEVRGLVAGGANANKTADQLVAEYDKARVPAYRQSFKEGDKEIISPTMERLMGSPTFENAMKSAVTSGKDRAITDGFGAFNPGVTVENGMIKFTKTKPNGVPQYPNLQYWDAVKKELDGVANVARRQGDNGRAEVAGNLAKTLRDELDKQVPSYANARGIAAQYFGESNALEAGRKLAGKRVDPQEISAIMRKMKPDERELFREGYASDWANRVISNISDSRDITKAMFNSPNERARALAVFGPAGMDKMQSRMSLETIMDGARKAMGNSTTARQLIEAGLAGGITGYETGDWKAGALAAGAAGFGPKGLLGTTITQGAQKLIGKVDSRTAKMVAELLTSDDPRRLQQGLRMAQKNPAIRDGLMHLASKVGLASQQGVIRPTLGAMQGPVPASGGNEQQNPIRP